MHKNILLCFGITILFLGIAVAPSVTSIDISKTDTPNDDLVEITLQLCKTSGVEDHKMFITQEQDEQLELLIESFKVNLDKAETRKETIEIYKDMVVSLDELGILPESTNCNEVQELVTGENSISNPEKKKYEKLKDKNPKLFENSNMFCQISGETTSTKIAPFLGSIFILSLLLRIVPYWMLYQFFDELPNLLLSIILSLIIRLEIWMDISLTTITNFKRLGGLMYFGRVDFDPSPNQEHKYYPAKGWVHTDGLSGTKYWDGSFYGNIKTIQPSYDRYYLGVISFTGIKIIEKNFFQGSALWVKLSYDIPT